MAWQPQSSSRSGACFADRSSSAVFASAAIAFVPFGIHGLSYNTFATGFFTAGCFLGAAWAMDGRRALLVAAGCAHAFAVFTYPTFLLPVACCFAVLYASTRPRSLRALVPGLLPAAIGAVATVVFFVHRGIGTIDDLVQQTSEFGDQGGDLGELTDIVSFVWSNFTYKYAAAALLIAAAVARRWRPGAALVPLLFVPVAALPADLRTSASANVYMTSFALLAPFVFLLVRDSTLGRKLLLLVWLPAAVAGVTTALSSANGPISLAIGFFPALIVTAVLIALVLERVPWADFAPAVVLLAIGVALQYLSVYRDAGIQHLTTPIDDGAYAGIYTTSVKRDFLETLESDLEVASRARLPDRLLRHVPGRLPPRPWPAGHQRHLAPRRRGGSGDPLPAAAARLLRAAWRAPRRRRPARSNPADGVGRACADLRGAGAARARLPKP